jgi:uracil-DNA glycosylase
MDEQQRASLLQIVRCPRFQDPERPPDRCTTILNVQAELDPFARQVPEPWRGSPNSPLLFVSSNPSIDALDDSPIENCDEDGLMRYFETGFPDCFPRIRGLDGKVSPRPVQFWCFIRARAAELWGLPSPALIPGVHFAITELVHCKSRNEIGVEDAIGDCMQLHWQAVLTAMRACVVVILGSHAQRQLGLRPLHVYSPSEPHPGLEGRWALTLPHANARLPRTLAHHYQGRIAPLQDALREADSRNAAV